MKKIAAVIFTAVLVGFSGLSGCTQQQQKQQKDVTAPPPKYTMQELIDKMDRNMKNLNRFRSKGGRLSCKIKTDKGLKQYDLDGVVVLYDDPKNLFLSGGFLGQPAMQLGSNQDCYWLAVMHDPSKMYWGYWKFAESEKNKWQTGGPIKLLEAIGQINLRNLEGKLMGPVLRREPEANVFMYMAVDNKGDWYVAKEIFLSRREPIQANKIVYYTADGSEYLVITFSRYEEVANGARMARNVDMNWPTDESYMKLHFGRTKLQETLPPAAFTMPDPNTFSEVEQVDKECKE
jgi:hypothetical protein